MELRKKQTAEELRRLKGIDSFLFNIGRGFKQLGTEYLTPASKVGGALISAYKGEPLDITQEQLIAGVMSGVGGGHPGGLPKGVGTGMTTKQALADLGTSVVKMRNKTLDLIKNSKILTPGEKALNLSVYKKTSNIIPASNVRGAAREIKRYPPKVLESMTGFKYADDLGNRILGQNIRHRGAKTSSISLSPEAGMKTIHHEPVHGYSYAIKGDKTPQGYQAALLENATKIARRAVKKAQLAGKVAKGRTHYQDASIEKQARMMSRLIGKLPKGKIPQEAYDLLFTKTGKAVAAEVKKKAPKLHAKAKEKTRIEYRRRARIAKQAKEGKLPDTFDEWLEGVEKMPKSKAIPKKKLTPGEMARALQEAASKKGFPVAPKGSMLKTPTRTLEQMIKNLPKHERAKLKIKRKAD